MADQLFTSMSDDKMASLIAAAERQVALACPAIRSKTAAALRLARDTVGPESLVIVVDCDDEVFRLGYGDFDAVSSLREFGLEVRHAPGLRIGVLVCDDRAWVFSPTALFVQPELHSDETPNAVELRGVDVQRILWRLVPQAQRQPPGAEATEALREEASACDVEVGVESLDEQTVEEARNSLELAPPLPFDVSRQVRVFTPYIQYVEIRLLGAAIQRHRVEIPKSIQGLGTTAELEGRLRTTFDLIERNSMVSSKQLEDELAEIRKNFTRALGKPWGRVLLRSVRRTFDDRIDAFRKKLEEHQDKVKKQLDDILNKSRENVIDYYLPHVQASPPDQLVGQLMQPTLTEDACRAWLDGELSRVFPDPEDLITDMRLEVTYRDVTYETLTEDGFGDSLREAYPHVNWDKPFDEFNAAKEREQSP